MFATDICSLLFGIVLFCPILVILSFCFIEDLLFVRLIALASAVFEFLVVALLMVFYTRLIEWYGSTVLVGLSWFDLYEVFGVHITYLVCYDGVSLVFVQLAALLNVICVSLVLYQANARSWFVCIFFTKFLVVNVFFLFDLFYFFIFFELTLIPMFYIIGVWGSRERRISAAFRFFLYTFVGSSFFLYGIFLLMSFRGSLNLNEVYNSVMFLTVSERVFFWFLFFLAFAVKTPIFPFHAWLPEAHAEAPTVGSILLAGVLLKLGPYGLVRFPNFLFIDGLYFFRPLVCMLCIVGILYTSCIALIQLDLKKIIAYSSIGHMAYVILGLGVCTFEGFTGSIFLMYSHGLVSAALFLAVGLLYERFGTRILLYYGGLGKIYSGFAIFFFFFILANLAFPGTSGFVGEFLILIALFELNRWLVLLVGFSSVLVVAFNIWLFCRLFFGSLRVTNLVFFNVGLLVREVFMLTLLTFFIFIFGICPVFFIRYVSSSCLSILFSSCYSLI